MHAYQQETTGIRQMHLSVFVAATGNHIAGWRIPEALTSAEDFSALLAITKIAERGKFDFAFFADAPVCAMADLPSFALKLEPATLLAALSVQTSQIGLVATISSTFTEPYNLARAIASVDQISGGRAGWNVVTTASPEAAANFGRELPDHGLRYEIADEYLQVVQGLWDSWEAGGLVANKETGQYLDLSKVHVLNHNGKYFKVRGPLCASRSPQGQPVVVQAGSSGAGQRFAAKYAEVVFTVQQEMSEAQRFYQGLKEQVVANSRPPDHCAVMPGLLTVVGRTEEEVRKKLAHLASLVIPGSALATMSERLGHDMSQYSLDEPVPDLPVAPTGVQSYAQVIYAKAKRERLTLREVHNLFALSRGYLMMTGTPKAIADTMEEWLVGRACDGFMLVPAFFPGDLAEFVNLVVPELQRRGLFRKDYARKTLRSHLGLPEPRNRFAKEASSE
ncbi:LLM class flavin-dependent oxidoreductase [Bradyrhizobium sp. 521_C7_N1_3]|uniref:LLM class flavin-dependent oxidoreductase n=1 Tax=Bradyrhizobium sp. 521_C7_N1_3 TaxID=3240368 RepID=UPI003F8B228A